jgi:hypothetical protein
LSNKLSVVSQQRILIYHINQYYASFFLKTRVKSIDK